MGLLDWGEHLAEGAVSGVEHVVQGGEHLVGNIVQGGSHLLGDGLNAVGLHGAAQSVDNFGDNVADSLGDQVAESQLGQTDDPTKLVHGDVGKLNSTVSTLRKFAGAFGETASGMSAVDTSHWTGAAADAFRAKFTPHPKQWSDAQEACGNAGDALSSYAQTVTWAQGQAKQAIQLYQQGQQATQQAQQRYQQEVDSYNQAADSYNAAVSAGQDPGPAPTQPAAFSDPGAADRQQAQDMLDRARQQRDSSGKQAASAVTAATNLAPKEPSFGTRLLDDFSDATQAMSIGAVHFTGGIVKGALGIVDFARSLNPMDPYNVTHPAEYVDGLSTTAAGLVHAALHPTALAQSLVGTGWGSDPFEAMGKLVPNIALAVATDGAGTAADAGTSIAEDVSSNVARDIAEDAPKGEPIVDGGDPAAHSNPTADATTGGDPIDVATGRLVQTMTDLSLPGVLPLVLTRSHRSDFRFGRWFGANWSSLVDQRIEVGPEVIRFAAEDGMLLKYPVPTGADPVLPEHGAPWPLRQAEDGYQITDPQSGRTLHFAGQGGWRRSITAITDRNDNRIDIEYDVDGILVGLRHSGGYHVAVDTEAGRITRLRLLDGADGPGTTVMRYGYDEHDRLASVTNSTDVPMRFEYDDAGRMTRWEDRNGMWYQFSYDEAGRCVRGEGRDGYLSASFDYDRANRTTRVTNSLGHTTTYQLNAQWQVIGETDPLGNTTLSEWDAHQRLLSRTDPLGNTTRYTYDEAGNLTAVTRPDGSRSTAAYNDLGLATRLVDPAGATWLRNYDERGNLTQVTDPSGATTAFDHDSHGGVVAVTDATGGVHRFELDAAGLARGRTDAANATIRLARDAFGRVTEIVDANGAATVIGWSIEGKPVSRITPSGAVEQWFYDGESNLVRHVDPMGNVTRTEIANFDQPTVHIGPQGERTEYHYDTELRLTRVTNSQGLIWLYEYDPAGRSVGEIDFDGRALAYTRDVAGNMVTRTNGANETTHYAYDQLGNLTEQHSPDAWARFTYDPAGRVTSATNADAEVVFARDALGRVVTETVDGRTLTVTYDQIGRRIGRRTPSGAESVWEYASGDQPAALHTGGRTMRFRHDPTGQEIERELVDGFVLTQTWDHERRLRHQTLAPSTGGQVRRDYQYQRNGLVVGVDDSTGSRSFDLDSAGRITAVHGPNWSERYEYDSAGNMVFGTWPVRPPDAGPADGLGPREYAGTLIRRAGNIRFEHDAQGRVVLRQQRRPSGKPLTWRYTWNSDDRLVGVTTPDGQRWRYRYDALGRRIAKQRLAANDAVLEQVDFTWDDAVLVEQTMTGLDTSPLTTTWEFEPGTFRPISQTERAHGPDDLQDWFDERFYAIVTDIVGAPSELVDPAGNLMRHQRHTVWGLPVGNAATGATTPFRFPGQYFDPESRLNYNFQRYYDPVSARYTSNDPLGLAPAPNPSVYVFNPMVWMDPYGLTPYDATTPVGGTNYPRFVSTRDGILDTADPALKQQIDDVANHMANNGNVPPPGVRQGGLPGQPGVWGNRAGDLPPQPQGYYHESDVWPGPGPRGTQRIVTGGNGEVWYSPDHYGQNFRRVR